MLKRRVWLADGRLLKQRCLSLSSESQTLKDILSSGSDPALFRPLPEIPSVDDLELDQQLRTARQQSQQYRSLLEQISTRLSSRQESLRLQTLLVTLKLFIWRGMARNQYFTQKK